MEPDLSNAGPFLAAALVTAGTVRIPHWPASTTQVGDRWREILGAMGAEVRHLADGTLEVTGPAEINGIDFADASELAPTLAALCALADRPLAADRHRAPARTRDRPAGGAGHRDQQPRRQGHRARRTGC